MLVGYPVKPAVFFACFYGFTFFVVFLAVYSGFSFFRWPFSGKRVRNVCKVP